MKGKSSIFQRARTVLKTRGTLGAASAGQFVDNFCDEVERTAYEQGAKKEEAVSCSGGTEDDEKEENEE